MARKPLFEALLQQVSDNLTSVVIIVIGAVAFFYVARRKPNTASRPPPRAVPPGTVPSATARGAQRRPGPTTLAAAPTGGAAAVEMSVLQRIKKQLFVGSRICLVWEVFCKGSQWGDSGKAKDVLKWYALTSDLYIMCRINKEGEEKAILDVLRDIEGIQREKVLFCTTQKGYEAFTRQVNPALLITNDKAQAAFLSGVLPYIVLVGEDTLVKPNVACVPSTASLACDDSV